MYELFISGILRSKKRTKKKRWYIPEGLKGIDVMVNQTFNIDDVFFYLDKENIYTDKDILYIAYRKLNPQDIDRLKSMKIKEFDDLYSAIEYIASLPKKREEEKKK